MTRAGSPPPPAIESAYVSFIVSRDSEVTCRLINLILSHDEQAYIIEPLVRCTLTSSVS